MSDVDDLEARIITLEGHVDDLKSTLAEALAILADLLADSDDGDAVERLGELAHIASMI